MSKRRPHTLFVLYLHPRRVPDKKEEEEKKMRVLIRLGTASESIAALMTTLERRGGKIVDEDGLPDVVISDDPLLLLGQVAASRKFFIHRPSSPRNIAVGVICFTPDEMIQWIVGK